MKVRPFLYGTLFLLALSSCSEERETHEVKSGDVVESVYSSVSLEPNGMYQVNALIAGHIDEVFVKPGDSVKKGDVLFTIVDVQSSANSENAKLADIADSVAQETKLIQEQHSNDKALLLEANEAAIRVKDWFGSLYSKSRDAGDSSKLDTNTRAHAYTTTQPQLFSRRTTSQIEDIHSN